VPTFWNPSTCSEPTGNARTALLPPWSRGKEPIVWDATCVDTLCKTCVPSTARTASTAERTKAEKNKRDLYALLTNQYQFLPIELETIGPFGDDTFKFVRQLEGRLRSANRGRRHGSSIQRISLVIHRGNAACVVATIPPNTLLLLLLPPTITDPKIHSTNNTLKLSPFVTEWMINQKCVFDIGIHFYIITRCSFLIEIKRITCEKPAGQQLRTK
jgi:hypothetical protein